MKNLILLPKEKPHIFDEEIFETILKGGDGLVLERIISYGQVTPEGSWYDQPKDEWILILEGESRLAFECGREICLSKGDSFFLPRGLKHRVSYTSSPCIWLALHGNNLTQVCKGIS